MPRCVQPLESGLVCMNSWIEWVKKNFCGNTKSKQGRPPCTPGVLHGCRLSLLLPCMQTPALHQWLADRHRAGCLLSQPNTHRRAPLISLQHSLNAKKDLNPQHFCFPFNQMMITETIAVIVVLLYISQSWIYRMYSTTHPSFFYNLLLISGLCSHSLSSPRNIS